MPVLLLKSQLLSLQVTQLASYPARFFRRAVEKPREKSGPGYKASHPITHHFQCQFHFILFIATVISTGPPVGSYNHSLYTHSITCLGSSQHGPWTLGSVATLAPCGSLGAYFVGDFGYPHHMLR